MIEYKVEEGLISKLNQDDCPNGHQDHSNEPGKGGEESRSVIVITLLARAVVHAEHVAPVESWQSLHLCMIDG